MFDTLQIIFILVKGKQKMQTGNNYLNENWDIKGLRSGNVFKYIKSYHTLLGQCKG